MITGIVLAAGRSRRLGRPKQLLAVQGEPLIRQTLRRILKSSLEEVLVITGHESEAVGGAIGNLPVRLVFNPDAALGQSTSVVAGLRALHPEAEAAVFLLGDQPGVDPTVINQLLAAWRDTHAPAIAPGYEDGIGNPVLFSRSVFPELEALTGDTGARPIVQAHQRAGTLHVVPVNSPMPPDIDTDADYAMFLGQFP